jgi:hypothetical protein
LVPCGSATTCRALRFYLAAVMRFHKIMVPALLARLSTAAAPVSEKEQRPTN